MKLDIAFIKTREDDRRIITERFSDGNRIRVYDECHHFGKDIEGAGRWVIFYGLGDSDDIESCVIRGIQKYRKKKTDYPLFVIMEKEPDSETRKTLDSCDVSGVLLSPFGWRDLVLLDGYLELYKVFAKSERIAEDIAAEDIDLMAANDRIEKLSRVKDDFMHFCSHDLKGYLSTVYSFAELLGSGSLTEEKEISDIYARMSRLTEEAINFTISILDLGRFEDDSFTLSKDKAVVEKIAADKVDDLREKADGKKISVDIVSIGKTEVFVDPGLYSRVIYNLVENAIKYSPAGGRVSIIVEKINDRVSVHVDDTAHVIETGDGIDVFDKYSRLPKHVAHSGWGIGLAMCRKIIEMHDGSMNLEKGSLGGNRFTLTVPSGGEGVSQ